MDKQPWYDKPLIVLPVALLLWIGYVHVRHRDTIRYENYGLIERGMSLNQVEDLLGVPPGKYAIGNVDHTFSAWSGPAIPWTTWAGNEGMIRVAFDAEGNVWSKNWVRGRRQFSLAWWCAELGWGH